jgi:diguanylate cyclase (GGDEF) domain
VLNYYDGERAYLFEFDWDKNVANNTFEICAKGVKAEIDNLQNMPLEHMRFWLDIFANRSIVVIEDLESLKDDPNRLTEYEVLHAQGIKSLIAVPILSDDGYIGFVGVDNPSANFGNTALLSNLAYFLGVEIGKNHVVRELQDLSYRDPLTGAFNRKGFEQITSKMADRNQPFGFLVADIDNFKMLNDTYGHGIGDDVLKEITKLMTSVFRSDDTVFRLGGDEFAVILTGCTAEGWKTICSKISGYTPPCRRCTKRCRSRSARASALPSAPMRKRSTVWRMKHCTTQRRAAARAAP